MQVRIVTVRSAPPRGYLVQWSVKEPAEGVLTFDLERAGGPEGPWERVASGLVDRYAHFDTLAQPAGTEPLDVLRFNQFRFFQAVYHRVTVRAASTSAVSAPYEYGPESRGKIGGMRRKAARDVRIANVKFSKMPCVLLKRRVWGKRCPECYDPKTKASTRGGCRTCYGTSFEGGFWAPVSMPARQQGPRQAAVGGDPKSDAQKMRLVLPDFPQVNFRDVIVSLRTGDRFEVAEEGETDLQEEPMYQSVVVTELDRSDVRYQIRVDPSSVRPFL